MSRVPGLMSPESIPSTSEMSHGVRRLTMASLTLLMSPVGREATGRAGEAAAVPWVDAGVVFVVALGWTMRGAGSNPADAPLCGDEARGSPMLKSSGRSMLSLMGPLVVGYRRSRW